MKIKICKKCKGEGYTNEPLFRPPHRICVHCRGNKTVSLLTLNACRYGRQLKNLRQRFFISSIDAARVLGISEKSLKQLENGFFDSSVIKPYIQQLKNHTQFLELTILYTLYSVEKKKYVELLSTTDKEHMERCVAENKKLKLKTIRQEFYK